MSSSTCHFPSLSPPPTITTTQPSPRAISTNTFDSFLPATHLSTMTELAATNQAKKDKRNPVLVLKKSSKRAGTLMKMKMKTMTNTKTKKEVEEELGLLEEEDGVKVVEYSKVEKK